jgi:hypothetical protein
MESKINFFQAQNGEKYSVQLTIDKKKVFERIHYDSSAANKTTNKGVYFVKITNNSQSVTKTNCELVFNNIMKFKAAFLCRFYSFVKIVQYF